MGVYRIELTRSAARAIGNIGSAKDRRRIVDRIAQLADDPRPPGCQKLSGQEAYRVRQGRFRIVYTIHHGLLIITVVKVAHRRDV